MENVKCLKSDNGQFQQQRHKWRPWLTFFITFDELTESQGHTKVILEEIKLLVMIIILCIQLHVFATCSLSRLYNFNSHLKIPKIDNEKFQKWKLDKSIYEIHH